VCAKKYDLVIQMTFKYLFILAVASLLFACGGGGGFTAEAPGKTVADSVGVVAGAVILTMQ
jgi:hypothetical protein